MLVERREKLLIEFPKEFHTQFCGNLEDFPVKLLEKFLLELIEELLKELSVRTSGRISEEHLKKITHSGRKIVENF